MEAIRKQASKLREQVAKQQQAVFKQFGGSVYASSENVTDEDELHQHQKVEQLYLSTSEAKHFQHDIVRGVEGYIVTGSKHVEIGTKLSEDSTKYGLENACGSCSTLAKAASNFGGARAEIEKERNNLSKSFGTQVAEPLRAMVTGSPLADARHLAQRYHRMRQEAESQAIEVSKRQQRMSESPGNDDLIMKLKAAETKLQELKSNAAASRKEAESAMAAVEAQQQRLTLNLLITTVESERAYHRKALQILFQLEREMVNERQQIEAALNSNGNLTIPPTPYEEIIDVFALKSNNGPLDALGYFLAEVVHPYQPQSDVEVDLSMGDYVVIRKVSNNGWAEGESKGKAGWFPMAYVKRRDRVLASKVAEIF